ncbi:MAG: hypothetical protein GX032_00015 [Tenericutes bacterium]|jgi:hypothetical protein|nr:hypothetical protein [Bacilli bacterium]MDD3995189.1 hypothetical protein [Bacilli bacterium]MDD4624456.1 hypothetical protein [Bacilli bacterium]MDD4831587.1 hypothetical protein [Bacilli bacterium]NLV89854.1 hypothetical protein [Mycoplasmatota bacterium]
MNILNIYILNFSSFYDRLNEVGKLVFYVVLLLFLILIVLIVMAVLQNNTKQIIENKQLKLIKEDEKKLEEIKKSTNVDISIDESNEKTKDLKKIVDEIKKVTYDVNEDVTDIYEDEQEKTAVISYEELLKGTTPNSNVTIPKEESYKVPDYDINETFLKSLKEFRKNL